MPCSSSLKLAVLASVYGKTYKMERWVRTISTRNPTTSTCTSSSTGTTNATVVMKTTKCYQFSQNSNSERISALWRRHGGRKLMPCVHLGESAQDKGLNRNLGLRGHKSSLHSSTEDKGGLTADMDSGNDRLSPPQLNHFRQKPPPQQSVTYDHQQPSKLLTLPTVLTLGRVAAVPLLVSSMFYVRNWWGTTATTSIFVAAAITDWLDGYIARRMKLGTQFGAFLDPVADKLMVAATLVLLCTRPSEVAAFGQAPWLLTVPSIAIIGREITMSAVREWAASQNSKLLEAVAVNNLGKWKTATQMTALTILLATRDSSLAGPGILVASGVVLLYISAGLALWSLVVYMRKIWKVLLK